MNNIKLSGYVAKAPAVRYDSNGGLIVNFPLCVKKSFKKDETGKYPVDFFPISTYGKLAEVCRDFLTKGMLVIIADGYLERNTDSNTNIIYTNIIARKVEYYNLTKGTHDSVEDIELLPDFDLSLDQE